MARLEQFRGHLTIALLNIAAMGLIVWQMRDPRDGAVLIEPAPTATPAPAPTEVRIRVHVSGAVVKPDVVVLGADARAIDAIEAAGGFSAAADLVAVNLAQPLVDGQQLHVPATGEPPLRQAPVAAAVAGAWPAGGADGGSGASSASGTGGDRGAAAMDGAASAAGAVGAVVNVNTATAAELEALPGIGPALAGRIVAHRQANGPFETTDDLLQVSGIGEKTLERFRDRVAVR
ncbi:MAG: helix-hairpin-helix domain-containing protein [Anaerolineae bacterium]